MRIELSIDELKIINSALSYYFYNEKISEKNRYKADDLLFELKIVENISDAK